MQDTTSDERSETPKAEDFLTPAGFSDELKGLLGRNLVYKLIETKKIKHVRAGRKILIPRTEITDFFERERQ